jgi:hypothetical protein
MSDPMMPLPVIEAEPTSVPPAVLLANHLKALKLPSFAREYEKVAFEAAQDRPITALSAAPVRTGAHRP